ncbi:hypothetical protein BCR44DRAFT_1429443, partial [Catenaria anguillulae PL171]
MFCFSACVLSVPIAVHLCPSFSICLPSFDVFPDPTYLLAYLSALCSLFVFLVYVSWCGRMAVAVAVSFGLVSHSMSLFIPVYLPLWFVYVLDRGC